MAQEVADEFLNANSPFEVNLDDFLKTEILDRIQK